MDVVDRTASYDPRPGPSYSVIGQNCVLPEYRGRGFGSRQILEILGRFRAKNVALARVTTSEHPFFIPARTMYRDLGFRETRCFAGGPDPRYQLIELEKGLLS
jgi:GNAT superfamily N-acetyltransferase